MDFKLLNTYSITRFGEAAALDCGCGERHINSTAHFCFFSGGEAAALCALKFVPKMSLVLLVSTADLKEMDSRRTEKALVKGGLRVAMHYFDEPIGPCVMNAEEIVVPEDAKMIIAVGGGAIIDVVRLCAQKHDIPFGCIITSPSVIGAADKNSLLFDGGIESTYAAKSPKFIVIDTDLIKKSPENLIAAGYGALTSKLVALFDYRVSGILTGTPFCEEIESQMLAVIDEAIKNGAANAAFVAEQNLKYSVLAQMSGADVLNCGAESHCAHAFNVLCDYEERPIKLRGETEFIFAGIILKLYKNYFTKSGDFFIPPPNNNARAEQLSEFLGLNEQLILKKQRQLISNEVSKIQAYKLNEYKDDLYSILCDYEVRLDKARKQFKRIYKDSGYSLINYIDESDASLSLAAAPDLKAEYTFLSYMKDIGLLEKYL